jgi:hypothetical protein
MGMGLKGMKIGEFAKITGVPTHTLRRLDMSGKLKSHYSDGGHRRYEQNQISEAESYVKRMKLLTGGRNVIKDMADLDDFFAYLLGLILADGTVLESGMLEITKKTVVDAICSVMYKTNGVNLGRKKKILVKGGY